MKTKRLLLVPLFVSAIALAACNGTSEQRILKIEFVKAGFGLTPYENLAKAFMKEHPDVKVKLVANPDMASTTELKLSTGNNISDIMMYNRDTADIYKWAKKGYLYDLSSVLTQEVEDGKTLADKLDDNALNVGEYGDGFWCIPEYYNISGFVYNATLFEAKGWSVPKTTTEFTALCNKICDTTIAGSKISPLVYCGSAADGYLYLANDGWEVTYAGVSNMQNFYSYENVDVYSPENREGRIYGLDLVNEYYFENSEYCYEKSDELSHIEAQSKILTYEAAMMVNGSWVENEMAQYMNESSPTLKMFKIPEVSDKTGSIIHADGYTTNAEGQSVVRADFISNMFIPKNSTNISDAIEFLKFIARDDILEMWTNDTNSPRPFNYDKSVDNPAYAEMSEFGKSVLEIANNNYLYVPNSKHDFALVGKAGLNPQGGYWFKKSMVNPTTYTGEYCVESDYAYAQAHWNEWIEYANNNL